MKIISIFLGKMVLVLCKLIGRGSAFPGTFALKINKNILKCFEKCDLVIAVTGSSGKGSTTKLIANVFKEMDYKVAYNDKGSNEVSAIVTTLLDNCTLTGKIKADVCVFEMDERYAKYVFPYYKPDYVVINNITRDQPPRQGHFDFVRDEIKKSLSSDIHIILNADDPYLQTFNFDKTYNISYFGIEKIKSSYTKNKFPVLNISRCPKCLAKLSYNYYNIEYLGDWYCPNCGNKRASMDYYVTDFNNNIISINDDIRVCVSNDCLFNLYNILGAISVLGLCGINLHEASSIISRISNDEKIFNKFLYNDNEVYVINNKNENATTFNQAVSYASNDRDKKTIVIGWRQISRRYDFDDLSWLYDIEFELLNNDKTEVFICCGPQRYDIAVRLKLAGVSYEKIKVFKDCNDASCEIKSYNNTIYAILNFDYVKPFNELFKEEE